MRTAVLTILLCPILCSLPSGALAQPTASEATTNAVSATTRAFLDEVKEELRNVDASPWRDSYDAFTRRHHLESSARGLTEFIALRVLFEATRDGGFFQLRWTVTDEQPDTKQIWHAWTQSTSSVAVDAECDEISAMLAELAHALGIKNVGLFWPTSNHTIAVWQPKPGVRIMLPTTQVYLSCENGFDDAPAFNVSKQRNIFEFGQRDLPKALPSSTARTLLAQLRDNAHASPEMLAVLRLHRARAMKSSVGECSSERTRLVTVLRARGLSGGDRRALHAYLPTVSDDDALTRLTR